MFGTSFVRPVPAPAPHRAVSCCLVLLLALPGVASAAKLYKYRDDSGALIFSDRPLAKLRPVEVTQLVVAARPERFTLRATGPADQPVLLAVNEYQGPVECEIELLEQDNVRTSPALPARWVVAAGGQLETVTLEPADPGRPWSYRYRFRAVPGPPTARGQSAAPYLLPFARGRSFTVSQAFLGKTSHNGPQNRYAVDIAMPIGTPVRAARGGVVMDVAFDFIHGGNDRERFGERANLVRILHDDGTMAVYAHLSLESVRFPIGARVEAGQVIAKSGNTGYSSGPHLHFAVQRNAGMQLLGVPFTFAGARGVAVTPERGMVLAAD